MEEVLQRFGHHPDPADDYCVEVEAIEGLERDVWANLASADELRRRVQSALYFKVGADAIAVRARQRLLSVADRLPA